MKINLTAIASFAVLSCLLTTEVRSATTLIGPGVQNGSFEFLAGASGSLLTANHWDTDPNGDVDFWTDWNGVGIGGTFVKITATDGDRLAFVQNGNHAYNLTSYIAQQGDEFAFSFDRTRALGADPELIVGLVYDDGGTITALTSSDLVTTTSGSKASTFTIGAGSPAIGKAIGLGLRNGLGSNFPEPDNFVLTVTSAPIPAPEPAAATLALFGLLGLTFRRRRRRR